MCVTFFDVFPACDFDLPLFVCPHLNFSGQLLALRYTLDLCTAQRRYRGSNFVGCALKIILGLSFSEIKYKKVSINVYIIRRYAHYLFIMNVYLF